MCKNEFAICNLQYFGLFHSLKSRFLRRNTLTISGLISLVNFGTKAKILQIANCKLQIRIVFG